MNERSLNDELPYEDTILQLTIGLLQYIFSHVFSPVQSKLWVFTLTNFVIVLYLKVVVVPALLSLTEELL